MAERYAAFEASRGFGSSSKAVCPDHVDDPSLTAAIRDQLTEARCDFCSATGSDESPVAAEFDVFMDAFMAGVRSRYVRSADDGVPPDDLMAVATYSSEEVAEELFNEAFEDWPTPAQFAVCDEIESVMFPDEWVAIDWQWPSQADRLAYSWDDFKERVKYQSRFLFLIGRDDDDDYRPELLTITALFNELARMLTKVSGLYRPLPAGSALFRGRMRSTAPSDLTFFDAGELGSPPRDVASANRMSPAGISMFYGASDEATAVAEIGAHSSYAHAVTGRFVTLKELNVIDLSNLPALPSPFDTARTDVYDFISFLARFVEDLTLPVEADGREHIDYVPTQVFSEFLRHGVPYSVHGLIFPSVQASGINVVVFRGPDGCVDQGATDKYAWLELDPISVTAHRVMTVIRPVT